MQQYDLLILKFTRLCLQKMDKQGQPIVNILEDKKQKRREYDRARRNSLSAEKKEEVNARRRAIRQNKEFNERNAQQRAIRQLLSPDEKKRNNAQRRERTGMQTITKEKRTGLQARRRANAEARRNKPCAESIAMPCPNAPTLPTRNVESSTHTSPARDRTVSPPASPSTSMPEYTIRTDGKTPIFPPFNF